MRQKRRKQAGNKKEKSDFVSLVLFGNTLEADIRKAAIGEGTILLLLFQVVSQDSQRQKNWYSAI